MRVFSAKKIVGIFFLLTGFCCFAGGAWQVALSEEDARPADEIEADRDEAISRREMLDRLNRILLNREKIRDEIEGVTLVGEPSTGYIRYLGTRLDRLDRTTLEGLFARVVQEAREQQMKNMERIHDQLRVIHEQQVRTQRSAPHTVPRVHTPPRTPPPAPPRVPPSPPRQPPR